MNGLSISLGDVQHWLSAYSKNVTTGEKNNTMNPKVLRKIFNCMMLSKNYRYKLVEKTADWISMLSEKYGHYCLVFYTSKTLKIAIFDKKHHLIMPMNRLGSSVLLFKKMQRMMNNGRESEKVMRLLEPKLYPDCDNVEKNKHIKLKAVYKMETWD